MIIILCRQRAPVENVLSTSGTSHSGMIDIQSTTKSKYYDHIVLLYLESRRCRYRSIIFACFYLYITVVIFIDYSDITYFLSSPVCQTCLFDLYRKMTEHFRPELFDDSENPRTRRKSFIYEPVPMTYRYCPNNNRE
jgi:hypothetical protein